MALFVSSASTSLDGYIAYEDHSVGPLFDWFDAGDIEITSSNDRILFHLTPASAEYWTSWTSRIGCLIVGRRLFDVTNGWGGMHPLGVPVVVLTHEAPTAWNPPGAADFHFVTTGAADAAALAAEIAGDRIVSVAAGTVAGQLLTARLLDEVAIDLVPVVLGSGRRYFGEIDFATAVLGEPTTLIPATRVMHLVYPVER